MQLLARALDNMAAAVIRDFGWRSPPRVERIDVELEVHTLDYVIRVRLLADKIGPLRPGEQPVEEFWIQERVREYDLDRAFDRVNPHLIRQVNWVREFEGILWRKVEDARIRDEQHALDEQMREYLRTAIQPDPGVIRSFYERREHVARYHSSGRRLRDVELFPTPRPVPAVVERFRQEAMQQIPWEMPEEDQTTTQIRQRREMVERELARRRRDIERAMYDAVRFGTGWLNVGESAGLDPEAEKRAMDLLLANLTPEQRGQYERHNWFEVIGGRSGRRYRIEHGRQMNIKELSKYQGKPTRGLCFLPQGGLATGDVMLGQKMALELYEDEALKVANVFPVWG